MLTSTGSVLSICLLAAMLMETPGLECLGKEKSRRPFYSNTLGLLSGNEFSFKTTLEEPETEIQFSFIVARHGMVLPFKKPFPLDLPDNRVKYGKTWKTTETTTRGKQLMNMVGRSLKTRYRKYLNSLTWDEISLTTIEEDYAVVSAEYLAQGLLRGTVHEARLMEEQTEESSDKSVNREGRVDYDRYNLLLSSTCPWFLRILKELNSELAIPGNVVTLKYCTFDFFRTIRKFVVTERATKNDEFWWVETPEHVFRLWHALWFEVQEGAILPLWAEQYWSNLLTCMFEYTKMWMGWHPDIAAMTAGRTINRIKEEKEGGKVKFHVHVTDDITFLSLLWNLPDNPRSLWPDFGDALILDFYKDETVTVSLFSGMMEKHETIYSSNYETLKDHIKEKGLDLNLQEYLEMCNFNPYQKKHDGVKNQ